MTMKAAVLAAAIGGVVALGGIAQVASAEEAATEKCYGVAKAGKNDCAGAAHACAGQSAKDRDAREWIKLPKGTCERIAGGSLSPGK